MKVNKVFLNPAECALDLGDGSERALYVNQDYILQKLKKTHRGINLMYTYYPDDETWPIRANKIPSNNERKGSWDTPYENYFPYRGGREGLLNDEPFSYMREIRQHGQDVVLSITIDPKLKEKDIILLAKDLRPYGRIFLRVNHECTGNWFCYNKRASYQEIADFFVMVANTMHTYAPNVKIILCAGMWQKDSGKLEMEDIFLEAHKVADIWSGDNYLSLNWGFPNEIATKDNWQITHDSYNIDEVYQKAKNTLKRLRQITGQNKPFFLSEMNADGDVNGPFLQAKNMRYFMELLQKDKEKWLSAFTLYQFRDDGRLGLEITDPNNPDVGIEQPLLQMYRKQLQKPFYSQKITGESGDVKFPVTLRWGGADDAEGIEIICKIKKTPHFCELFFEDELVPLNMMIEMNGFWFYKAPGTKHVDLMSYFFENPKIKSKDLKIRFFCPPQDGMNKDAVEARDCPDGDWLYNSYTVLPKLPKIRILEEPIRK